MQNKRRPLVAGNWKMNGSVELAKQMIDTLDSSNIQNVDVLVCPPFPFLSEFNGFSGSVGAQNLSEFNAGAHTGEVSATMLKSLKCDFVLVGHSERRTDNGESDALVAKKVSVALEQGLTPILCVGEPEAVRESGEFFNHIQAQIDAVVDQIGIAKFDNIVVAYEPVWAIGTGKTASPLQAQQVHEFIRQYLAELDAEVAQGLRILYGGSVKAANANELFSQPDVDGGLIGGASLEPQEFLNICLAAKG
ncbi:triose-phosphate isomerase [Aliiglaciecola lipolytica]|uniref:Triosephosphate isomerase n=1 Tax=Aliiglaciecola lipolytica E3 TaxID=1127673 RepID=K6YUE5_9ALTE|nr:triose-phosphate isomerase [Aliiglaciecola lipolytica]GAC14905.1 triosephosphate isomerase [Aliiglaciecola lipolytica E3]